MKAVWRSERFAVPALVAAVTVLVGVALVDAAAGDRSAVIDSSGGRVGASGNPEQGGQTCARCHSGGVVPEVGLDGPMAVAPGSTHAFTLTISGGQEAGGGLNVSATDGLLAVLDGATDVQVREGEITHTEPKDADAGGDVVFSFLWQAPSAAGEVMLYGAGNSVDLNGNTAGDGVDTAALSIDVVPEQGPTETPTPTAGPPSYETVFSDLNNPHGLHTVAIRTYLAAEGGTGDPMPGQFTPGNGDGRVLELGPMSDDRGVVVDGLTNAQDPGGGVVGANHAIPHIRTLEGGGTETVTLVAQSGGPGQLRPEEAAKILEVADDGTVTVLADPLAFETENNPGGEEGPDGIDSNPWRLLPHGDRILISDAGANDILSMDPDTGELALYAVFEPIGDSQAIPTGIAAAGDVVYVALLGPMFSDDPATQMRRLEDRNGDGDALDDGENEMFIGGLHTPTDVRIGPFGHVYVLEMFPGTLSRVDPTCFADGTPCDPGAKVVVATGLTAATAMTWDDNFDALVTMGPENPGGPTLRTDRIVRVPYAQINPTETPEPETPTPGTPTAETPTPGTPTTPPGTLRSVYLPWASAGS